ncbi:MAG: hypothetical protein ACRDBX_05325, partial [Erysipelotrichaceae bacterium]
SSFSSAMVGVAIAAIGFTTTQPTIETKLTPEIFSLTMFLMFVVPVLGLACNLVAMKYYPLTREKMEEIQEHIAAIKTQYEAETGEVVADTIEEFI